MKTVIPSHIRVLCFDLDNTLFDRQTAVAKLFARMLDHSPDASKALTLQCIMERDAWAYTNRDTFNTWLAQQLGSPWTPERIWQEMVAHWQTCPTQANVQSLLTTLHRTYPLALLSNGSGANQRTKLKAIGCRDYFATECIWISQEEGIAKPDVRIFQRVVAHFGCPASSILYIGDHPEQDVLGAHQAGMSTCWLSHDREYPINLPKPDIIIPTVLSLVEESS